MGFPIVEFGVPKVDWFRTLKNSARNCSVFDSVIRVSLTMEKSRFDQRGTREGIAPQVSRNGLHGAP